MRLPALRGRPLVRVAGPIAAALLVTAAVAGVVAASDHQDTPLVELNQRYDINDVFAFPGSTPDRVVLVLGTSSPLTPAGTPTARFGDVSEVMYQLKVDNTGDGVEDLVFQMTFTNGGAGQQRVTMVGPVRPAKTGTQNMRVLDQPSRTIAGLTDQVLGTAAGTQLFAGPRDDPFFIDLEQFFRVLPDRRPQNGPLSQVTQGQLTFRAPGQAVDFVRGLNDLAIVIELPPRCSPTTASTRASASGARRRCAAPPPRSDPRGHTHAHHPDVGAAARGGAARGGVPRRRLPALA